MVKKYSLDNKKFLIFVSLMFLVVFIVVSGASYAFFTTSVKGKEFAIYTGNLKVDYSKKTVAELKEIAKDKGIEGYTSMKKAELVAALEK